MGQDPWHLNVRLCVQYVYGHQGLRPSKWARERGHFRPVIRAPVINDKTLGPPVLREAIVVPEVA